MPAPSATDAYLTFHGRLDRDRWLLYAGALVAVNVAVFAGTWWLDRHGILSPDLREMIRTAVQVFTMVPWAALDWKRLHDLDHPGRLALACPALFVLARVWELPAVEALVPRAHASVETGIAWLQFLLALFLAYVYMFLTGTPGPNRFGEDPRRPDPPLRSGGGGPAKAVEGADLAHG